MKRLLSRRPSPALIISLVALFVALGGSAYAVTRISGKNLVNRSVKAIKLKKHTITGTEIAKSKLGSVPLANRANSASFANSAGTANTAGASSLSRIDYETATGTFTAANRGATAVPLKVVANCPSGTNLVGGGASVSNETPDFVNDQPVSRTAFSADGFSNSAGGDGSTMTVTAICAPAARTTP